MATILKNLWTTVIAPNLMPGSTAEAFNGPGSGWGIPVDPSKPLTPLATEMNTLVAAQIAADKATTTKPAAAVAAATAPPLASLFSTAPSLKSDDNVLGG